MPGWDATGADAILTPMSESDPRPDPRPDPRQALIGLYRALADHTAVECATGCKVPFNCCHPAYCQMAIGWAQAKWGVALEPTGHPRLPLLGPQGCIAQPHLRPMCSVHACCMAELGEKPGHPQWTARYKELLAAIEAIENPKDQVAFHPVGGGLDKAKGPG